MARDLVPLQYLIHKGDDELAGVWVNVAELCLFLDLRMVGESDGRVAALLDLKMELQDLLDEATA